MPVSSIESAVADLREGRMIIVVDDEDRENEGDLTIAAEKVTPDAINFMAKHGRGLICLPMTQERLDELHLPPMVADNRSPFSTAFTVSIEARQNVTTGISAADRATTILTAINPQTHPSDLVKPGHVFPLRARPGGVLERTGQTEASIDLARIAGLYPAGVICEIMNDNGTMARMPQLEVFAAQFGLKIVTIADLIQYRLRTEKFVEEIVKRPIETEFGRFTAHVFQNRLTKRNYLALSCGDIAAETPTDVRVHMSSIPGDVFLSGPNPSGVFLRKCLKHISNKGCGVVLYLQPEVEGQRLAAEIQQIGDSSSSVSNQRNDDTVDDGTEYGIGAQILTSLGLRRVVLLTGRPKRLRSLSWYGLEIVRQDALDGGCH